MSRHLKMAEIDTIRNLHQSGHSNREIARLTGVHRDTIAKYLAEADVDSPQTVDSGDSKPAKPDHRDTSNQSGPKNACKPYEDVILAMLDQGLSGVRIYQDLKEDYGFSASYSSVRRFLQGLRKTNPLPFRTRRT